MQKTDNKIKITMNGAEIDVESGLTLGQLVDNKGLERKMIAIEYNGEIIPRHDYDDTEVRAGDVLEVVHMVGGG
jgi:sulfur carrier protein